jgi:hypothetical protein
MIERTYRAKFVAESVDHMGYRTYVFENLNCTSCEDQYIMCVRYPNWNQATFNIGDVGFLNVRSVEAGVDKWFDGTDFNSYRYTDIVFMKFVLEKPMIIQSEVILD